MSTLWRAKMEYKRLEDGWDGRNIADILPYERLYEELTQVQLQELLRDAKRNHWEVLDLHGCGLDRLPEELGELMDLRFLDVSNSSYFFEKFEDAIENSFSRMPDSIGNLANLQELRVSDTRLTALPDSIANLTNLLTLGVFSTNLTALPDSIGNLANLQTLDVSKTDIMVLPDSIGNLANLQKLYLYDTVLTVLPDSIGNLANLKMLYVNHTPLTSLPDSIGSLQSLKMLDLSKCHLTALPDSIGSLQYLETLNLSWCSLTAIPYSLVQLGLPFQINYSANNCINLYHVTLEEGDISLFEQPREVIEAYYRDRVTEAVSECKVIFLGDGAAGKSSLIERMVHDTFQEGSLPTDGVKMTRWTAWPDKDKTPLTLNGKPLALRLLDFGGQEIMHAMHRCFLTAHTVYVIVCESRNDTNIDSDARRWVETVRSFAPDCPVILALNKSDLNNQVTVNESALRDCNPRFLCSLRTSAKVDGDPGVQQLVDTIFQAVPGCLRQMTGNRGFLSLKQKLETMEEDYIQPEQFQQLCNEYKIEKTLRAGLLDWFRDLGIAYPYAATFRDIYVLNPAWLTNGVYRLIVRTETTGFLKLSDIRKTLGTRYEKDVDPDKIYSPQEMEFILHVMRRFEISRPVKPEYGPDGVEMIPLKLDKNTPPQVKEFPYHNALHLRWEAPYLPNTLVHRLIIRKFNNLDQTCVWRTGAWFRRAEGGLTGGSCADGCELLAEMTKDSVLDVYAVGSDARGYMDRFREEILRILVELNIKAEEYVYCAVNGKKGRIPLNHVLARKKKGKKEIYLGDIDEDVSIDWILRENYVPENITEKKSGSTRLTEPGTVARPGTETRDFFISYNNAHDGDRARWIADTLISSGITVHFQEYDCKPGTDFLTWMEDALSYSRGFLAVWSSAYEDSEYCRMELHAATVRRHKDNRYALLPVRVEDVPVQNPLFQSVVRVDVLSGGDADREKLLDAARRLLA